jgi:hypothetical protein
MNGGPRCIEERKCIYKGVRKGEAICRILVVHNQTPPYKSGECPFYKRDETSIGGDYSDEKEPSANGSSDEGR